MKLAVFSICTLIFSLFSNGSCQNITSRPSTINIGAIFTFNSSIGEAANVAINAAVEDINSDPNILNGSKLVLTTRNSNCSGFLGLFEALQLMEAKTVAIVGPQSSAIAHIISHVSDELQVPLVSFGATDPTISPIQFPYFIRTTQSDFYQMAAVASIVNLYQWKLVTVVYTDDEYGRNGIAALDDKLAEKKCKISYRARLPPVAGQDDILDALVKVNLMESRVIVVHVNSYGLEIFSVAQRLEMIGNGYVWIATDWLMSILDLRAPLESETMNSLQGVIALRQHTADSSSKRGLISRWGTLTKKYKNGVAINANTYGLYAYDSVWTIARALERFFKKGGKIAFSRESRFKDDKDGNLHIEAMRVFDQGKLLLDEIKNINFTGITGQIMFNIDGELIHPSYDILNIVGTGWRTIGFWSNYSGLSVVPPEKLYDKPANFTFEQKLYDVIWPGGTVERPRGWVFPGSGELKIGVPDRVSFLEFVSYDEVTGTFKGYCVDVFLKAIELLPYPVPYKFVPFGDGKKNPNYTDLCNKVGSSFFDAAIGDIVITKNRTKIVDFTQPYIDSGLVVLAPVKRQKSNAWTFLQPFTLEMWCVIGVSFIVVGIVVWILEHRINEDFRGPPKKQIATILWFSFSTLFFAHRENTVSTLGRAILLIWLFVVLIIQSSYTASLTSILTVQQLSSPIQGIESLAASNDPIGYQTGSFSENYMVEEMGISQDRLVNLTSPKQYLDALEAGPSNGGVAAIVDEMAYVELFLHSHCQFQVVGSDFTRTGWGFAFPKDSPLAIDMSTAILTLSENGDLQKIHDKWLIRSAACSSEAQTDIEADRLHFDSFKGLFLLCGIACVIALLVYLCIMLREYIRYTPPDEQDPSGQASARSGCSLKSFLSFVDDRKQETKRKSMKQQKELNNDTVGSES
ncbi:glutamate receptor 3.1-like isoform X1 [Carex littledalei]|uniref:Glutamate receptor n=1 Tax=Carex littledalei TaxID=544730 RepID=A0A833VNF8_9POAL|nr:glutamate receptor 3.1-like isoform X1 [Carex littledalei]